MQKPQKMKLFATFTNVFAPRWPDLHLHNRGWVRNLKTGVQVFGPVKQKPVVGGNRKGHVDPLPYPPPSDTKILDILILQRLLLTLLYCCCIEVNSYLLSPKLFILLSFKKSVLIVLQKTGVQHPHFWKTGVHCTPAPPLTHPLLHVHYVDSKSWMVALWS